MTRWAVDPEKLRTAASVVGYAVEITEPETATAATENVGDAELASALSAFMQALTGGWMQRVSESEAVSRTLAASAALYDGADSDGVRDVCRADDF
ncbi:hypothetical protein [Microbacterium sp. SORGH_AS_0888]|uniref:hypothetical protein n=1 Tax=Microbacterium sp. SORGH_AS_0888 TaxID=3041791 RepID=UPI00277EFFD5|nr:hypothetical protein [Microbacterium sp. SORGH_AS_0888]MDQ1129709.1 ABC-type polar amino acid transport system ATPase subunit [Microbacterium sp. SORGH_AS_0888]